MTRFMKSGFLKSVGLAGALAAGLLTVSPKLAAAQPSALAEGQPLVTQLGGTASAMTYWVNEADGWHVVTIVQLLVPQDERTPKYAVVRFSSVLLPGQSQLISVPPTQARNGATMYEGDRR
jgi:hypothetical protein